MNFWTKLTLGLSAAGALGAVTACGGFSNGPSTVESLTISGTLGASSSVMGVKPFSNSAMAVSLTDLEVYAVAFTSPPSVAEAEVGADGSFTISIPGAKGAAVTAIFRDKNDESQVGTIVFEDTSSKDMNGNNSQSSSVVLGDSVALGNITLGTDGKVVIPVSQIADKIDSSTTVSSSTAFDPTGTWYMKAFSGTLPSGYQTVTSTCNDGPCIGFPITLVRMAGKKFSPTTNCDMSVDPVVCATTDGTIGTEDRYALSIWGENFANGMGACGSKTGFTAAEARAAGRIHIATLPTVAGNTISFGDYSYQTPTGFGGDASPFDKPWMKTGALSTRPVQDCRPTAITHNSVTYNGWACKAEIMTGMWPGTGSGNYGWQVGVEGGGCFNTATAKPVNVTNWSTIGIGSCTQSTASSTYGNGFYTHTCTYTNVDHDNSGTTAAISLSCTHTGGQFTDSTGPTTTPLTTNSGEYLGQPTTIVASGQPCESIGDATTADKLAAYRCYAEAYWSTNNATSTCQREYRFNWAATTPEEFAQDSERGKPKNAFITNILNYTPDGTMATLEDEETESFTINTGANSSTFCETSRRTVISFKKVSDTRMLVDLKQTGQMNSTSAACQGAAKDALAGKQVGGGDLQHILTPQKMIFYADTTL
ncbi:hypothetical protein [Bdellovibrio sp. HCB337]|uniref:hypothetical protein n=1 Tax=Bdellovibrio sp. HCB337 TaxID=3394358 RepID=UPI0039A5A22A